MHRVPTFLGSSDALVTPVPDFAVESRRTRRCPPSGGNVMSLELRTRTERTDQVS